MPPRIDDGLAAAGFAQPFEIQTEAIPVAMQGRDVCGRARTGSGKTLAFGVPMLARILDDAEPARPLGLVLVPTRELAVQVAEVLEPVAAHAGQRILAVYGGASRHDQIDELAEGVEIVVATPLRLIDLIKSDEIDLVRVEVVVLDEADRMADDGFTPQVEWILRHCTGRNQTMLFSATLDGDVGHLIRHYLKRPGRGRHRRRHRHGRHDAPPLPRRAPHGQGPGRRRDQPGHPEGRRVLPDQAAVRQGRPLACATSASTPRRSTGPAAGGPRAGAAPVRRGPAGGARRHRRRRPAASTSTTSAPSSTTSRRRTAKDYLHRSGRTARAGRDGWAVTLVEYNQHTQMRILQRTLRLPLTAPIEVFSNDPRLHDFAAFHGE